MDDPWGDHRIYIDVRLPERYRRAPSPDNERAVNRVRRVYAEIRSGGTFDLTTLSVALRQLRNLLLASQPAV